MKRVIISLLLIGLLLTGCTNTGIQTNNNIQINNNIQENNNINSNNNVASKEIIVLDEVPDYISDRGIILRGAEDKYGLRLDVETTSLWYERYTTDCNLSVESTDEEFQEFVKNINEKATFNYDRDGNIYAHIEERLKSGSPQYYYYIYKTSDFKGDLSSGNTMYYFEEGMSCDTPIFYDASGKYLLDTACYDISEDVVLKFLEPVMTEVSLNSNTSSDEAVIQSYIHAIHALEVSLTDKKPEDVLNEDDVLTVTFTSKEGKVFSYYFPNEEYLIYNEEVYEIDNFADVKILSESAKEAYVPEKVSLEGSKVQGEPEELKEDGWRFFYSSDESVYIKQKAETGESSIVDGDVEIPVNLATGVYGPNIEKFDVDKDGDDEILIAECEGTGTGLCLYGLCIVEKTDEGYLLTKYEYDYFSSLIEEKIGYHYNENSHEVSIFEILPAYFNRYTGYTVKLNREEKLENVIWEDIVYITFEDGKVYLSAPSGYVYEGIPVPDYDQAIEVKADLRIDAASNIYIGFWYIEPDEE